MTTREKLHRLIDKLPDSRLDGALRALSDDDDPMLAAFRDAPEDDEPWTEEDEAAVAEVKADRAAGVPTSSHEEIKREFGIE